MDYPTALRKMRGFLNEQRSNVDQFFTTQKATMTDLQRIRQLTEQRERMVGQLEKLCKEKASFPPGSDEELRVMSGIVVERELLRAANHEARKFMDTLKEKTGTQTKITGRMLAVKKRIERLLPGFK